MIFTVTSVIFVTCSTVYHTLKSDFSATPICLMMYRQHDYSYSIYRTTNTTESEELNKEKGVR